MQAGCLEVHPAIQSRNAQLDGDPVAWTTLDILMLFPDLGVSALLLPSFVFPALKICAARQQDLLE